MTVKPLLPTRGKPSLKVVSKSTHEEVTAPLSKKILLFWLVFVLPFIALGAIIASILTGAEVSVLRPAHRSLTFLGLDRSRFEAWEILYGPLVRKMYFERNLSNTDRIESGEEEIGVEQSLPYPPVPDPSTCVNIEDGLKFDCFPRGQVTEKDCNQRGCCYTNITINRDPKVPICYYPKTYNSYKYTNITIKDWGIVATMAAQFRSPYPKDSVNLVLHIIYIDENTVYIKMNTTGNTKNQNMWPLADDPVPKIGVKSAFDVKIDMNSTGFQVMRKSNGKIIFDTKNLGGFIHTDQFFQISSKLPSKFIYGLGEQRSSFLRDVNWNTISLFTHDSIPLDNVNGYGFHPVYLCMEGGGLSHGVVSLNSYPTDIILQPGPAITFRTIGGILAFVIFMGPTPIDVVKQYTSVVNQRAPIPPYWALGFHLCRFGYKSLADVEKIWNQTVEAGIPLDTQWADLDYMKNRNDFTLDDKFKGLDKFVDKLHKKGMHFVPLVDPGISGSETPGTYPPYDDGMNLKIFVMDSSGKKPFIGKVWNSKTTLFPDFTHPRIIEYWFNQLKRFHDMVPFDGAWIDMNEPSNFLNGSLTGCPNNNWEHPPYVPTVDGGFLSYRTLCMSSLHWNGVKHYDIHNLYGTMEMIVTSFTMGMLRNSRPFVISRSSAPSLGNYGGHWTGDVRSTWDDMKHSVADLFSFSLFGVPLVGADICGFNGNTSVDLCQRWSQLGAFYPFSRNHNSDDTIAQDPVSLGDAVASAAKKALKIRYMLLPYLYTLFADNANDRTPVVQPLFFQFPEDAETYSIMTQFMWGRSLLFAPVLEEGMTYVKVYLPKGVWYNGYTKERILSKGQYFATPAPLDTIPIFTRGGSIIPEQIPGQTTTESRKNPMMLNVALDENSKADGHLFWDDGESLDIKYNLIEWKASPGLLESKVVAWQYETVLQIKIMQIYPVPHVNNVTVDSVSVNFLYNATNKILILSDLNISLNQEFKLVWK